MRYSAKFVAGCVLLLCATVALSGCAERKRPVIEAEAKQPGSAAAGDASSAGGSKDEATDSKVDFELSKPAQAQATNDEPASDALVNSEPAAVQPKSTSNGKPTVPGG